MLCGSASCFAVMVLSRYLKILVLGGAVLLAQAQARPAQAEIDLGTWDNYATMAEQGAVCGAFADIMAMQVLVDEKLGRLWSERRNYSGSVIRRAAALEGRGDLEDNAIDELLNRYSMWLLNNLANPANAEILGVDARDAAQDMVGDVCATLYAQADKAIVKSIRSRLDALRKAVPKRHPTWLPARSDATPTRRCSQRPPSRRPKPTLPP